MIQRSNHMSLLPHLLHTKELHLSKVQSEYKGESGRKHCPGRGSFPCGNCSYCPLIKKEKIFSLPNGEIFSPVYFANCQTRGLVYLMLCECCAFYIGKTNQEFWHHITKHIYSMQIGNRYLPLGRHVVLRQNYKMPKVFFTALDRVHIPDQDGDWNKTLLQREQRWIFRLRATTYPGLNESISFAPFLQGFASGKNSIIFLLNKLIKIMFSFFKNLLWNCSHRGIFIECTHSLNVK